MTESQKLYGKFRGTVVLNEDPLRKGRLFVQITDHSGVAGPIPASWAMPAVPFAGRQMGCYMLPQIGAGVWIEFEQGDADFPIWTGCWWGSAAEVPALALTGMPASPNIVLQTTGQNTLSSAICPDQRAA